MAVGQVNIYQENNYSGPVDGVERRVLFIGLSGDSDVTEKLIAIDASTDLDDLLGDEAEDLINNIEAARLNASSNFTAFIYALQSETADWVNAIETCLEAPLDLDVEIVAITMPTDDPTTVLEMQGVCEGAIDQFGKYITIHASVPGIKSDQDWSEYMASLTSLITLAVAPRVYLVPQLHGTNLGAVVGRLCNSQFSLADSPMRVKSGAIQGMESPPRDKSDAPLTMTHLKYLSGKRFSVPQTYTGLEGYYWADHMSLDAVGGDFQVYENLRVMDYITRRVRLIAIRKVADRSFNSSEASTKMNEGDLMAPLRTASKASIINGEPKPGLVKPPRDGDITIVWADKYTVEFYIKAAPIDCPKTIDGYISLDLSL